MNDMKRLLACVFSLFLACLSAPLAAAQPAAPDSSDLRAAALKDPDHFRWALPDPFPSKEEWERRARELRLKLLLSAGLWPERERTPLNAKMSDFQSGPGFKVAKVYFESLPGFLAELRRLHQTLRALSLD